MSKQKYIETVLEALKHCFLYYEMDNPTMQDHDYDQLYRSIVVAEYEHEPVSFSPTQYVGFDHRHLVYQANG